VLVGGGIGIAPLKFLARALGSHGVDTIALLGARNKDELTPLLADFTAMGIAVQYATDDGSMGTHGFVTELLPGALTQNMDRQVAVYCCGPQPMMKHKMMKLF